jgi:hypothetical protein
MRALEPTDHAGAGEDVPKMIRDQRNGADPRLVIPFRCRLVRWREPPLQRAVRHAEQRGKSRLRDRERLRQPTDDLLRGPGLRGRRCIDDVTQRLAHLLEAEADTPPPRLGVVVAERLKTHHGPCKQGFAKVRIHPCQAAPGLVGRQEDVELVDEPFDRLRDVAAGRRHQLARL